MSDVVIVLIGFMGGLLIGVPFGFGPCEILNQLEKMKNEGTEKKTET